MAQRLACNGLGPGVMPPPDIDAKSGHADIGMGRGAGEVIEAMLFQYWVEQERLTAMQQAQANSACQGVDSRQCLLQGFRRLQLTDIEVA